jgi:hypothetical protein
MRTDRAALCPVPTRLLVIQKWFASKITRPLDENDRIVLSASSEKEETAKLISFGAHLSPEECIEIYNQQYWWRLLSTLQEIFPTLVRLFGYNDFNRMLGVPYLQQHPPNHWSLNFLGKHLPEWIRGNYDAVDAPLVAYAADVDWASQACFFAPAFPSLTLQDCSAEQFFERLSQPLHLQPFLHLFNMPFDLFTFRENFLKEPVEYWLENDFPKLSKDRNYYFLVFRNLQGVIEWKEISIGEWTLLGLLKKGMSLQEACGHLEAQDDEIYDQASENITGWVSDWAKFQWLTLESHSQSFIKS